MSPGARAECAAGSAGEATRNPTLPGTVTARLGACKVESPDGPTPVGLPLPVIATDTVPGQRLRAQVGARMPRVAPQPRREPLAPSTCAARGE